MAESPDKGVIRMWAVDDDGRSVEFVYDDLYFIYAEGANWVCGSGTPKREFILVPQRVGCLSRELPVVFPPHAVIRRGETVSQEEAEKFGLVFHKEIKERNCAGCPDA